MNKKGIVITSLFLLIIALLLAGAYFLWQKNKTVESETKNQHTPNISNNQILSQIEAIKKQYNDIEKNNNQQIKADNEIYTLLLEYKDVNICPQFVSPNSQDLCYKMIAQENLDIQLCDKIIKSAEKILCQQNINLALAVKNKDLLFCYNLDEGISKSACLNKIIDGSDIQPDDCEQIPLAYSDTPEDFYERQHESELRDVCKAEVLLKLAKQNQDINLCNNIPLHYQKALCFGYLKQIAINSDNDNDGLTFMEEYRYGTNPDNPDSDGDSYLDGDEVKNGYNPNGEGKLIPYPY